MENVLVKVRSVHTHPDGTRDLIENESAGTLERTPEAFVLRYEELSEDGDRTSSELRYYGERAVLKRSGASSVSMVFAKDRAGRGIYRNSYGSYSMDYTTHSIDGETGRYGLRLTLSYTFSLSGGPGSGCVI